MYGHTLKTDNSRLAWTSGLVSIYYMYGHSLMETRQLKIGLDELSVSIYYMYGHSLMETRQLKIGLDELSVSIYYMYGHSLMETRQLEIGLDETNEHAWHKLKTKMSFYIYT
jgi:hypothetical protein